MEPAEDWCLIDSNPGVFTELIKKFGVEGAQVEEIWTIDDGIFENLRPVHGLIFLSKYVEDEEATDENVPNIFFAKQVIYNACVTQVLINLLLNCNHPDIQLGAELTAFKELSMPFDPKMRGLTLSNSVTIRTAHNSMPQQAFFKFDSKAPRPKEEDVYHYIGYIPIEGRLYELDGLRDGPIDHGPIRPGEDWLDVVRPIIVKRTYDTYCEGEFHINVMALVSNLKRTYECQINELVSDNRLLGVEFDEIENEIRRLKMLIEYEDIKMDKYRMDMIVAEKRRLIPIIENIRRSNMTFRDTM